MKTRRRPADYDERLRLLFEAKNRGDTAYLIDALRREHDVSGLPARWLADDAVTEAIPALVEMLDVSGPRARCAAIRALDRLGPPEDAKSRLIEMALSDDDNLVREWAAATLGHFSNDVQLTPLLISLLADSDWHVSSGAATGLQGMGDVRALEPLQATLRRLRKSPLQWYLHRLPFKEAIAALKEIQEHEGALPHRRPRHSAARNKNP